MFCKLRSTFFKLKFIYILTRKANATTEKTRRTLVNGARSAVTLCQQKEGPKSDHSTTTELARCFLIRGQHSTQQSSRSRSGGVRQLGCFASSRATNSGLQLPTEPNALLVLLPVQQFV